MNKSEIYFIECLKLVNRFLYDKRISEKEKHPIFIKIVKTFFQAMVYCEEKAPSMGKLLDISSDDKIFHISCMKTETMTTVFRSLRTGAKMSLISFSFFGGKVTVLKGYSKYVKSPISWTEHFDISMEIIKTAISELSDDERCWLALNGYVF